MFVAGNPVHYIVSLKSTLSHMKVAVQDAQHGISKRDSRVKPDNRTTIKVGRYCPVLIPFWSCRLLYFHLLFAYSKEERGKGETGNTSHGMGNATIRRALLHAEP